MRLEGTVYDFPIWIPDKRRSWLSLKLESKTGEIVATDSASLDGRRKAK